MAPVAGAVGFFRFDDDAAGERAQDRYATPSWEALDWPLGPTQEVALVGGGASRALLAVGSNFWTEEEAPPQYVRAMALALARRLEPTSKPIRLADFQLKKRRQPAAVDDWQDRDALSGKLWSLAWRIHELGPDGSETGLLLLDLAAAFDPSDLESMERYRELSDGRMERRWEAVLRLPEGVDAPDFILERPGNEVALPAGAVGSAAEQAPRGLSFAQPIASILVPAAAGAGQRFVRLEARVGDFGAKRRPSGDGGKKRKGGTSGLPVEFAIGLSNVSQSVGLAQSAQRARAEFLRGRDPASIPAGIGVEFRISDDQPVADPERLAAAGAMLLQMMEEGVPLAPDTALAGGLGFGGTLTAAGSLSSDLLRAGRHASVEAHAIRPMLAVPLHAEGAVADLASMGELRTLLDVQIIGCRSLSEASTVVGAGPPPALARAAGRFAEIARAADKRSPADLLANAEVRRRLAEVVELWPEHLSAAQLLRLASGRSALVSLDGSLGRLRMIEAEVRQMVARQLGESFSPDPSPPADADGGCVAALSELRRLRPRIDTRARPYADSLVVLVEDLRVSLRSRAHGPISAARADELRRSLDALELRVAGMGFSEPE